MSENKFEEIEKTEQVQDEPRKVEKTEEEKREDRRAWIRFIAFLVLVLIPAVTGIALLVVGNKSDDDTLTFAGQIVLGAGVPGVMVILVAAVLIWKYGVCLRQKADMKVTADRTIVADEAQTDSVELCGEVKEETPSQREREQQATAAVNSSSGYVSCAKMAEYEAQSVAVGMKHAPKWGIIVGIGGFLLLVADLVSATVFLINRIFVGAIICAALLGVALITVLIFMIISRAIAMNGDIRKAKKITKGKVKACFMIVTATTKSGGIPHGNGGTVRI